MDYDVIINYVMDLKKKDFRPRFVGGVPQAAGKIRAFSPPLNNTTISLREVGPREVIGATTQVICMRGPEHSHTHNSHSSRPQIHRIHWGLHTSRWTG